jgi:hypothetical protein
MDEVHKVETWWVVEELWVGGVSLGVYMVAGLRYGPLRYAALRSGPLFYAGLRSGPLGYARFTLGYARVRCLTLGLRWVTLWSAALRCAALRSGDIKVIRVSKQTHSARMSNNTCEAFNVYRNHRCMHPVYGSDLVTTHDGHTRVVGLCRYHNRADVNYRLATDLTEPEEVKQVYTDFVFDSEEVVEFNTECSERCVICQDALLQGDVQQQTVRIEPCKHAQYHADCVRKWIVSEVERFVPDDDTVEDVSSDSDDSDFDPNTSRRTRRGRNLRRISNKRRATVSHTPPLDSTHLKKLGIVIRCPCCRKICEEFVVVTHQKTVNRCRVFVYSIENDVYHGYYVL